ncbi:MAG TPA: non-homologous end-joining DNA ligase [Egibacteraceae bacterium]|nr:non-homologous end-joining DNA ligase [Egibacteraceae bacterium]
MAGDGAGGGRLDPHAAVGHPHDEAPTAPQPHLERAAGRARPARDVGRRVPGVAQRSEVVLDLDGHQVAVSHPDKVFFAERGETKLDLVRYYQAVREPLLAAMGGRPVLLQRFPDGAAGSSFFQKRVPKTAPPWLQTTVVTTVNGTPSRALVAADLAHVVWAVNIGCLGFHVWPFLAADPDHADELRIDLDPQPGVAFTMVREAAHAVRALLEELGLTGHPKTTGGRGVHVYLRLQPRWDSYAVRAAAVALARELERRHPALLTAAWWKEERGERVFVDFNQNAPHKTVFGAWSVRARPGAQVSTPFRWEELDTIDPDELSIATVPERVARDGDPWGDIAAQSLDPLLELHERDRANGLPDAPWPPVYPKMPDEPPRVAPSRARRPPAE